VRPRGHGSHGHRRPAATVDATDDATDDQADPGVSVIGGEFR